MDGNKLIPQCYYIVPCNRLVQLLSACFSFRGGNTFDCFCRELKYAYGQWSVDKTYLNSDDLIREATAEEVRAAKEQAKQNAISVIDCF